MSGYVNNLEYVNQDLETERQFATNLLQFMNWGP